MANTRKKNTKLKIGLIGGGNMGMAILNGIHKKHKVLVSEKREERVILLRDKFKISCQDLQKVVSRSDILLLAVKPQDYTSLLKEMKPWVTPEKLVISIAAGITTRYIEERLDGKVKVIRTMPNLPVQVGEGITAVTPGRHVLNGDLIVACRIFSCVGKAIVVEERLMNAVTALSGSGPAYVFYVIECLQKAAKSLKMDPQISKELIVQTLRGSLRLFEQSEEGAGTLRKRVTSKKGTTEAALKVLAKNKVDKAFRSALKDAAKRARELSQ